MKAVLRGKLKALSTSKKKLERAYTSNLTAQLKALEQKEADTPKIIKIRAEIDQKKQEVAFKESAKPRAGSLKKLTKLINS